MRSGLSIPAPRGSVPAKSSRARKQHHRLRLTRLAATAQSRSSPAAATIPNVITSEKRWKGPFWPLPSAPPPDATHDRLPLTQRPPAPQVNAARGAPPPPSVLVKPAAQTAAQLPPGGAALQFCACGAGGPLLQFMRRV
eukprot:COSAG01_NODE_1390_length_10496_cov_8.535116_8_plen_139_part_00